jgi:hypothetical protein
MTKIVFYSNELCLRGTTIALYDYALFNQTILGNESLVAYDRNSPHNDRGVIKKFEAVFATDGCQTFADVDRLIREHQADLLYAIKSGERDGIVSNLVPTMVHGVFPIRRRDLHGSAYAFVSDWLSDVYSNGKVPAVPHIVCPPAPGYADAGNLRQELGIPQQATVFACHGGQDSFSIRFVRENVLPRVLSLRADSYFVFLNITPFMRHDRVLFLPGCADSEYKDRFINTADAMLHARKLGESFGLACAEFAVRNKPVITFAGSPQRNHLLVLGKTGLMYHGPRHLTKLLLQFDRQRMATRNWDVYSERFAPERIMKLFDRHLIQEALEHGVADRPRITVDWNDAIRCEFKIMENQGVGGYTKATIKKLKGAVRIRARRLSWAPGKRAGNALPSTPPAK